MDKTILKVIEHIVNELDVDRELVEAIIEQQQKDIATSARNKEIDFILLKGFGTFSSHGNSRRPFRSDKKTRKNE